MRTLFALVAGALLALSACTGTGGAQVTPTPTTSAQPTGPLLVVLQDRGPGTQADTVAMVKPDGTVVARALFEARQAPYVGNAMPILQDAAQVGRDGVYYIDGSGVVRLLKPTGEVVLVTTFPMTPEQGEAWFAVSPDGSRLLAGVLTLPAVGDKVPGAEWRTLVGSWKFDLESASAGGQAQVLKHVESATSPDDENADWKTIFPIGWTQTGPVAMVGAPLATQNEWHGGPLYVVDAAGQPGQRIGGADVTAAHVLVSGMVAAASNGAVTVRDAGGQVLWRPAVDGHGLDTQLSLSPDGDAVAMDVQAATRSGPFALPAGYHVHGFVDSRTAVGRQWLGEGFGHLSYVQLGDAGHPHDLGLMGRFVGVWSEAS